MADQTEQEINDRKAELRNLIEQVHHGDTFTNSDDYADVVARIDRAVRSFNENPGDNETNMLMNDLFTVLFGMGRFIPRPPQ